MPSDISFSGYLFLSGVVLAASPNAHYRVSSARTPPPESDGNKNRERNGRTLFLSLSLFLGSHRLASLDDEFLPEGMPKETNERTNERARQLYVQRWPRCSVSLSISLTDNRPSVIRDHAGNCDCRLCVCIHQAGLQNACFESISR